MSAPYVRQKILDFMASDIATEKAIDLTGEYQEIPELIEESGIGSKDPWLGVQFVGSEEEPIDIVAGNTQGQYRESGLIYLHITAYAKPGAAAGIIARAEMIRSKFRGQRLDAVIIKNVSPAQFGNGVTLNFEGGYIAALVELVYTYDFYV